jgi:hypothetical protein
MLRVFSCATFNDLIKIINEIDNVDIPTIPLSRTGFDKVMNGINKYAPLIGSYNDVVNTAKTYEVNRTKDNLNSFYISTAIFALDATVVVTTLFHSITFKAVGTVYRASGLNTFAFKNPALVSFILKNSYRTVKATLVKESRNLAIFILDSLVKLNEGTDWDQINKDAKKVLGSVQDSITKINISDYISRYFPD